MKQSKIKGYIKDLENKNKEFSYNKIMRLLDVSNYVYLDEIKNFDYKNITNYDKSKYFFKEISQEFDTVYELISKGQILMGVCLLRNVYEEILYIMATSINIELDINVMTRASYFKEKVIENFTLILTDVFTEEDISYIYSYLSKITHVSCHQFERSNKLFNW
jgi:hypothetical protein